jgi:hypothetical protein
MLHDKAYVLTKLEWMRDSHIWPGDQSDNLSCLTVVIVSKFFSDQAMPVC